MLLLYPSWLQTFVESKRDACLRAKPGKEKAAAAAKAAAGGGGDDKGSGGNSDTQQQCGSTSAVYVHFHARVRHFPPARGGTDNGELNLHVPPHHAF
jgi:hypothetical protein